MAVAYDRRLGRGLVLDELFDLSLYQALQARATGELQRTLGELIPIETKHFAFWQDLFDTRIERLDVRRRLKLAVILAACRVFGVQVSYLVGACVPILPVLVGAKSVWVSIAAGAVATVVVSAVLAFLSGMDLRRRLALNAGIVAAAVAVTYLIGLGVRALWGIEVG